MRRGLPWLGLVLLAVAGCRAANVGIEPGAASSEQAIQEFLNAAREPDLQAMSAFWGSADGLTRDKVERRELEQRLLIMACHLKHDQASIGVAQRAQGGRTIHPVTLTQGTKTATVPFTTVRNTNSGKWFVEDFDLRPARELCSSPSGRSSRD